MKKHLYLLLAFLLILWTPFLRAQIPGGDTLKILFRNYTIKKYKDYEQNIFKAEIYNEKAKLYEWKAEKASHLQFVAINDKYTYDITGDSIYNFVFQEYVSADNDAFIWYILSLDRHEFKVIDKVPSLYSTPWLSDIGYDGVYEIIVKDYTFAYWNASFLDSPYVQVILRLQDGKYRPALNFMQQDEIKYPEALATEIRQGMQAFYEKSKSTYPYKVEILGGSKSQRWGFISPKLWGTMLTFIYAGQADLAWKFLDQAWYEKIEGKDAFLADFKGKLAQSPFWAEIKQMNNWQ